MQEVQDGLMKLTDKSSKTSAFLEKLKSNVHLRIAPNLDVDVEHEPDQSKSELWMNWKEDFKEIIFWDLHSHFSQAVADLL